MKPLGIDSIYQAPAEILSYAKSAYLAGGSVKWIPAGLLAILVDLRQVYGELFYTVALLVVCDLLVGVARAWHDPNRDLEYGKLLRSLLKLFVIAIGVAAIALMEHLITIQGLDTKEKLTTAALLVIGVGESVSILDHLTYFFPKIAGVSARLKDIMGRNRTAVDDGG